MSASADFQKGLTAYNSGDYATALREWTPLAEQGDAMEYLVIRRRWFDRYLLTQNLLEALPWKTYSNIRTATLCSFGSIILV